jgi:uncharacterized lipoprotein
MNMHLNTYMNTQFSASAAVLAALCALLSGCASEPTCDYSDEPYMAAGSVPSLRAPEGMSAPDRTASLVVPPAPEGEQPPGKGACLDRPPSYFATSQVSGGQPSSGQTTGTQNSESPAAKESAAQ